MQKYRYQDFHGEHSHQICVDGSWRPLIGTSRVGSVLSKPFAWYGSGKAVEAFGCPDAKVLTRIKNKKATGEEIDKHMAAMDVSLRLLKTMTVEQFAKLIDQAYRAHDTYKKARAPIGTDRHAQCEAWVKYRMKTWNVAKDPFIGAGMTFSDEIRPFIDWSMQNVKRFLWSEGHNYSEKNWVGGISDAGYEKHDGTFGIIDFKSAKEAYIDHFWQCAGYDINISENGVLTADGDLIYTLEKPISEYCVFAFGAEKPKPQFNYDMAGSKEAFQAMLTIYRKLPQN
jgi:hypothetical protein